MALAQILLTIATIHFLYGFYWDYQVSQAIDSKYGDGHQTK